MLATLQLPLPPSVNTYWRNYHGRIILSKAARDYKAEVFNYVAVNCIPSFKDARLQAIITIFPRDKRAIDIDNRLKSLFDALEWAGMFDNDSQFDLIQIGRGVIKKGGGCTIVISTLD
jgi:crossover junction endodeoxyribonuclease RusA